eukprot:m.8301 g.8301  ORF g.8301 m.8301 type:complete len:214 (-) comp3867_c0_seq1:155-796(-)
MATQDEGHFEPKLPGDLEPKLQDEIEEATREDLFLKAAQTGNVDKLKELAEQDPGLLTYADQDGYTALHRAAYNGYVSAMIHLIDMGANVNVSTGDGWTPLHCAAKWRKTGAVWLLLSCNADINAVTKGNQTPLHLAVSRPGNQIAEGKIKDNDLRRVLKILLAHPLCDSTVLNDQRENAAAVARRQSGTERLFELNHACLGLRCNHLKGEGS